MANYLWASLGLNPVEEYYFAKPRMWRFDYAFPKEKIAVEQEGGVWIQGRHTRGWGFIQDMEKYNEAARRGWRVFRFTPKEIEKGIAQQFIAEVMKND